MKHRGGTGLGKNDDFGLEHVEFVLLIGKEDRHVW